MKLFLLIAVFISTNALANDTRPCAAEREFFCKGIQPGGGAIMKCLRGHLRELSPTCRAIAENVRKRHEEAEKQMRMAKIACGSDVEKLCSDVPAGRGAVVNCLRAHQTELTRSCKLQLATRP